MCPCCRARLAVPADVRSASLAGVKEAVLGGRDDVEVVVGATPANASGDLDDGELGGSESEADPAKG
eukprot:7768049-Alexandrium_andersonii.AAC.1